MQVELTDKEDKQQLIVVGVVLVLAGNQTVEMVEDMVV